MTGDRFFLIATAPDDPKYRNVLNERRLRHAIETRKLAFSKVGGRIVLREADIDAWLSGERVEPIVSRRRRLSALPHQEHPAAS